MLERPQDLKEERIVSGTFRCDRCGLPWPMPWAEQDGSHLCRRCEDPISNHEATILAKEAEAFFKQMATMRDAPAPDRAIPWGDGIPAVTAISPLTLNLTRGGASGSIAVTGVNLTTADTWSSSNSSHITVTPTVNSTTSVTLSISADGTTTRGNYNLTFNSDTLTPRKILSVR